MEAGAAIQREIHGTKFIIASGSMQRFMAMVGIDAACVIVAFCAIVAAVAYHQAAGLPVFVAAILAGFGAQIWFILGLARAGRLGKGL